MKVSIITATYNSANTILDCVKSINDQTYNNIEHIIIDGKSRDNTLNLIKSIPNRVKVVVSEKDLGIYDAMNKGIILSTGNIIAILNSDDLYASNEVIENIVNHFEKNKNLGILYGDLNYVSKNNLNLIVRKWKSNPYYDNYFEDGNVPPHPSTIVLRKVYSEVGLFNLKYHFAADYEFLLRAFKNSKFEIMHIPFLIVKMRLGGATNKNYKNILRGNIEIWKSWNDNNLKIPKLLMLKRLVKRFNQYL